MPQSPDIRKNPDGGIFDFPISGQSLIKENCHKLHSRTGVDIDMKLGPASKLDKRNITPAKENDDYIMSKNYDIIVSHFFDLWTIWSNSKAEFQMHSL